jgi:hypothetical protein
MTRERQEWPECCSRVDSTFVLYFLGQNLDAEIGYSDVSCVFPQVLQANAGTVPQLSRSRTLTSIRIHFSLIILPFDGVCTV